MSNPRFSIVIPSYNSAPYLDATIHSLAIQECKDFEVIVIDDHSSDDSVAVATEAIKKYGLAGQVTVRPDTISKGVANCRNLGIKNARAEWICFLDSDDLFLAGKLSGTLQLIQKYGASCQAYHHGVRQFEDGSGNTITLPDREGDSAPRDISAALLRSNFITTSSVTLHKALADELGGFDSRLHGVEDYLLWLRVSKKTNWFYSAEVWTDYRVRGSSLMGGREMTHYITQNKNLLQSARSLNEFTKEELALLEHSLFDGAMQYYALVSLNNGGWSDFIKGLAALGKLGKGALALRLFRRHLRNLVLRKLHGLRKGK